MTFTETYFIPKNIYVTRKIFSRYLLYSGGINEQPRRRREWRCRQLPTVLRGGAELGGKLCTYHLH